MTGVSFVEASSWMDVCLTISARKRSDTLCRPQTRLLPLLLLTETNVKFPHGVGVVSKQEHHGPELSQDPSLCELIYRREWTEWEQTYGGPDAHDAEVLT